MYGLQEPLTCRLKSMPPACFICKQPVALAYQVQRDKERTFKSNAFKVTLVAMDCLFLGAARSHRRSGLVRTVVIGGEAQRGYIWKQLVQLAWEQGKEYRCSLQVMATGASPTRRPQGVVVASAGGTALAVTGRGAAAIK